MATSSIRRVRLIEPVGARHKGEFVILPAGTEGQVADPLPGEHGFAVIVDTPEPTDVGHQFDGARAPELVDCQVEEVPA